MVTRGAELQAAEMHILESEDREAGEAQRLAVPYACSVTCALSCM